MKKNACDYLNDFLNDFVSFQKLYAGKKIFWSKLNFVWYLNI